MLVIHPGECIDCGVCVAECPIGAIEADTKEGMEPWVELNQKYAQKWPNITQKKDPPQDADLWKDIPGKLKLLSEDPFQKESDA